MRTTDRVKNNITARGAYAHVENSGKENSVTIATTTVTTTTATSVTVMGSYVESKTEFYTAVGGKIYISPAAAAATAPVAKIRTYIIENVSKCACNIKIMVLYLL